MAEAYTGEVRDGVVIFDDGPPSPPTGTRVRIEPVGPSETAVADAREELFAGTRELLLSWARRAEEIAPALPADLAENHDHYAHGKPRG